MTETTKPRIRFTDTTLDVVFPDGRRGHLRADPTDHGAWRGTVRTPAGESFDIYAHGRKHAYRQAACLGVEPPPPARGLIARELADEAERDVDGACRVIRMALRRRTGIAWSVSRGRGTAYGWITVTAPPRRRPGRFSTMTAADQAILASIFGSCHQQGISVRTEAGVRAWYACTAAGLPLPAGLTVETPSWD